MSLTPATSSNGSPRRPASPAASLRLVKEADVRDNLGRLTGELRSERPDLVSRYESALERLEAARKQP